MYKWLKMLRAANTTDDVGRAIQTLAMGTSFNTVEKRINLINSKENLTELSDNAGFLWAKVYAFGKSGEFSKLNDYQKKFIITLEQILFSQIAARQLLAVTEIDQAKFFENFQKSFTALTILNHGLIAGERMIEKEQKAMLTQIRKSKKEKEHPLTCVVDIIKEQKGHVDRMMARINSGELISINDMLNLHLGFHKRILKHIDELDRSKSFFVKLKERFLDALGIGKPSASHVLRTASTSISGIFGRFVKTAPYDEVAELLDVVRNYQDIRSQKGQMEAEKIFAVKLASLFEPAHVSKKKFQVIIDKKAMLKEGIIQKLYKSDFSELDVQNLIGLVGKIPKDLNIDELTLKRITRVLEQKTTQSPEQEPSPEKITGLASKS